MSRVPHFLDNWLKDVSEVITLLMHNRMQKLKINKAIKHFEIVVNGIKVPQVNGNPEPSTKHMHKDHNIAAKMK
jgi:hypothetical protein